MADNDVTDIFDESGLIIGRTFKTLTEQQIKIINVLALLRIIMETYPPSSAAYQHAEQAYNELSTPTEP